MKQPPRLHRKAAELSQAKREERLAKYEQVVALRKQGFSQTAIGEQVGIGHMTVSRWLAHGTFPEYQSPLRKTSADVHLPYLRERWEAGCHNMAQLYRELQERGYKQSYQSMHDQLLRLLPEGKKNATKAGNLSPTPLSSKSATFLFLRRSEDLEPDEQETLITLRHLDPDVIIPMVLQIRETIVLQKIRIAKLFGSYTLLVKTHILWNFLIKHARHVCAKEQNRPYHTSFASEASIY